MLVLGLFVVAVAFIVVLVVWKVSCIILKARRQESDSLNDQEKYLNTGYFYRGRIMPGGGIWYWCCSAVCCIS